MSENNFPNLCFFNHGLWLEQMQEFLPVINRKYLNSDSARYLATQDSSGRGYTYKMGPIYEAVRAQDLQIATPIIYGAIIGDICGSIYEFNNRKTDKPEEINLINSRCFFTDDTVLTTAVMDAIKTDFDYNVALRKWGCKYPRCSYGDCFNAWLDSDNPLPYNSYGNGSAMRVSPVGWLFNALTDWGADRLHNTTRSEAAFLTGVTHNHPEGYNGAFAVVESIISARAGESKEKIKKRVMGLYGYNLNQTLDEIRPTYQFDETCQGSVPQAIIAFLESHDFVSAIQNAISIGGDSDTIACITGSIAEAYYKEIPQELKDFAKSKLPDDIQEVMGYKKAA
jgi:ADP-ribosylglycohydrolase